MKTLKESLEKYFNTHVTKVNIQKLISSFKINAKEYEVFINAIYELEKEGKIIGDNEGNYLHKPEEYYLYQGTIQKSSKHHYYLNLGNGFIINIADKNLNGAKENDIVFVSVEKSKKHNKQKIGEVVRVVTPPTIKETRTFYKAKLKKNYTKNFYYVEIDNNIIYIPDKDLNGAYTNDLVSVYISDNKYGKIIEILERKNKNHVFEYMEINGNKKFIPLGTSQFDFKLIINEKEKFEIGDRILVDLDLNNEATYIKKLNNNNDINSYIDAVFCDFGFPSDFSEKTKEEVKNISTEIPKEEMAKRTDLRHLPTFTMDGSTAKDLDDAISFEYKDGRYYLYVHIAHVSHYVKEGSAIFEDAYKRGTSVYPANRVFHMLPEELSNGVCSLNPNADRLATTCKIEFDEDGNLLDYSLFHSVINSDCKMSYEKVNDILYGNITKDKIDKEYEPFIATLFKLNELSDLLQKQKIDRGFLKFEDDGKLFSINENGIVENMNEHKRGPAELMIENFMLKKNEIITSIAFYYQIPFMYRNHEGPTVDQICKLKNNICDFKKFANNINKITNPKMLQKILLSISNGKSSLETKYYSKIILKCLNRAFYDVDNIGHYALALKYYGTFTSPIRRFPDLLNHIIIDKVITGDLENIESYYEKFSKMSEHCNETQLAAEMFEKHIDDILLRDYISNYIGQEMDAKIMFISHQIICVKTSNQIYAYMKLPKTSFVDNKVIINGQEYEKDDPISITINGVKENSDEILFTINENKKVLSKKRKKEVK